MSHPYDLRNKTNFKFEKGSVRAKSARSVVSNEAFKKRKNIGRLKTIKNQGLCRHNSKQKIRSKSSRNILITRIVARGKCKINDIRLHFIEADVVRGFFLQLKIS